MGIKQTTLCYIKHDGNYLMLYRNKKKNDQSEGKWLGIGGKFEPGETGEMCMLREVEEETGLILTKYHFHGVIHFISDEFEDEEMFLYSATEFEGTLTETCDEGELRWIPEEEMLSLPLWEGDKVFLRDLIDGKEHISYRLEYEGYDLKSVTRCE